MDRAPLPKTAETLRCEEKASPSPRGPEGRKDLKAGLSFVMMVLSSAQGVQGMLGRSDPGAATWFSCSR